MLKITQILWILHKSVQICTDLHKYIRLYTKSAWFCINLNDSNQICINMYKHAGSLHKSAEFCIDLECSWRNISECSWMFLDVLEWSWIFLNVLEYSWISKNVQGPRPYSAWARSGGGLGLGLECPFRPTPFRPWDFLAWGVQFGPTPFEGRSQA